jgi:hypothetical protein
MPYPKIIVLGDFALPQNALPQNALPQNNWPANPALAGLWQGLKPGLNRAVNGAINLVGILWVWLGYGLGIVWGMVRQCIQKPI